MKKKEAIRFLREQLWDIWQLGYDADIDTAKDKLLQVVAMAEYARRYTNEFESYD